MVAVTTKEKKAAEAPAAPVKTEFKYGVSDVTEGIGTKTDSDTRRILRNAGVEKNEGRYGWNSKADLEDAIKACKAKMRAATVGEPAGKPVKAAVPETSTKTTAKAKIKAK